MRKHKRNTAQNTTLGKLVFAATLGLMLAFFWWLLIFDHGVSAIH